MRYQQLQAILEENLPAYGEYLQEALKGNQFPLTSLFFLNTNGRLEIQACNYRESQQKQAIAITKTIRENKIPIGEKTIMWLKEITRRQDIFNILQSLQKKA